MFEQGALLAETARLNGFAFRLTKNKADADDLFQSTCLRALEKADHFENGTNLFAWTSKIMFNMFISGYNRRAKFECKYDPELYLSRLSMAPTQDISLELGEVSTAMMKLSPEQRQILILICARDMTYQEVSDMLGIPIGTVRSRLARGREHLTQLMNKPSTRTAGLAAVSLKSVSTNMQFVPAHIASRALQKRA